MMENEWIEHDGGPCPVAPATRVATKFRDGKTDGDTSAAFWSSGEMHSEDWWKHEGNDEAYNIIAYRVVQS